MYGLAGAKELQLLRKKLFKEPLPYSKPRQAKRPGTSINAYILSFGNQHSSIGIISVIHKSDLVNAWCLPFLGSDRPVVLRTQRFLYEHEKKRPIQMQAYIQFE